MREQRQSIGRGLLAAVAASVIWGSPVPVWAQSASQATPAPTQPAKPVAPPPADLEPGVNTSAIQPSSPEAAPADVKPAAPKTNLSAARSSASATKPAAAPAGKAHDSIQLDTTQITGNRELPKVLYIVPWKRSDLGDLVGKPVNSLLDEVLTPVDRDVFKRQNRYYDALKPDAPKESPGAATGPAEKR